MRMSLDRARLVTAGGLLLAGTVLIADGTPFLGFHAADRSSAGPTGRDEDVPITFGNPAFQQRSIADRATQLADGKPNSGSWDMNTVNETGAHKGRYLFTVFETGQSGVQRHDLLDGRDRHDLAEPGARRPRRFRCLLLDAVGHAYHG